MGNNKDTIIGKPINIGQRVAQNRFVINAMECCDANEKGGFSELVKERYRKLAEGGAGLIVFESITLQDHSKARKNQIFLDVKDSENINGWKAFIKDIKKINPNVLLVVQLNHGGEKSSDVFSKRMSAKPLYGNGGSLIDEVYVEEMMDTFVEAAKVLHDCGADGVDLKYGHGYMMTGILRPYNDRKWKYGGSWENRSRVPFELTDRVYRAINDKKFLIGSKITMWEGIPGGFGTVGPDSPVMDLTEPIALIKGLEERGTNFFIESNVPSMPLRNNSEEVYHHFTMAKIMKDAVKPETIIIGGAYSILNNGNNNLKFLPPEKKSMFYWGNQNIEKGFVDMIAIGRQSFADPYLPIKYLTDKESEIKWCIGCNICWKLLGKQLPTGCAINNEYYKNIAKNIK